MVSRGPDGAGLLIEGNIALAHRRLAVIDTSEAGAQPMTTPDGRFHLLYNGELYNDAELRADLISVGAAVGGFRGSCDTETVLWAFATWGPEAFSRMRGMFSVAVYDTREQVLHLARDPLGIKPLYYHIGNGELTFASEPKALLAHPKIDVMPNMPMASAYLSTLCTTLGRNTMFNDVWVLKPGERAEFDARTGEMRSGDYYKPVEVSKDKMTSDEAADLVRGVLEDSVEKHLRSDVPLSALLSGGLDSTIICQTARESVRGLNTWCAGAQELGSANTDFEFAREAASSMGAQHTEVAIDGDKFREDWPTLIERGGLPLSTPNEIAIHAVAKDMRKQGFVVTLSGEGADELFGGYELALQMAENFCYSPADKRSGGRFQLESSAWVAPHVKPHLLSSLAWGASNGDRLLNEQYDELYKQCEREVGEAGTPLDAHLRFLRKNNLTGLLQRLDRSTMLASIEGRTPFADVAVAEVADSLPMNLKLGGRGKQVLRDAWRGEIPESIVDRKKQSFALPFQNWVSELAWRLDTSPFAKMFFGDKMRREVQLDAKRHWQLAWPMLNLALWGDSWFG
ncbi:MAG: asparagine synthase (glutamine-hydrolyzing) [Planctomycetota bacterium]|jgi:asparagine synthase (glutamine-hydrolysing)